ncbi:MAG: Gfo/Idh/MocA family oxidoreductase [bacterium]|nr:Gfo/Idh/MocA family oxidoreductase [bacterium]
MPVRFAMCGTGWVAKMHADAIAATPDAELVAVHNHRTPSLNKFAASHQVSLATTNWTEFLALVQEAEVDVAVVGTPNALHASQSIDLMGAGAHVLVEKPMATSVSEATEMVAAAKQTNRILMTGHLWRFDPEAQWLRAQVDAGALGMIVRSRSLSVHTWWGPDGWFQQSALAGGGALADMGVHAIDTTRYLLGDPKPMAVTARISTNYGSYDVDDTAVLFIDWDNGVSSQIESGWWQVHSDGPEAASRLYGKDAYGSLFPTFVSGEPPDEADEGDAEVAAATEDMVSTSANPHRSTPPPYERDEHCGHMLFERQMAHVVAVAQGKQEPAIGPDVGLTVVQLMEAAYRSANKIQWVTL